MHEQKQGDGMLVDGLSTCFSFYWKMTTKSVAKGYYLVIVACKSMGVEMKRYPDGNFRRNCLRCLDCIRWRFTLFQDLPKSAEMSI